MEINYLGEHLWPGNVGHLSVLISFTASLLSVYSFFMATRENRLDRITWFKTGRISWWVHVAAVTSIVVSLFYIIYQHYYEYYYAWRHSSNDLPTEYMISCFWEGQEGSFLLWLFWNMILGSILVYRVNNWSPFLMTLIAFCQVMLSSMLLGFHFESFNIGSSPFELLRNSADMKDAPLFADPAYLEALYSQGGKGLNPLLQNYWMVIHPPVLFLGFASVIIPFAYALSGFWKKNYSEWIKPALPWTLFALAILGTGIMMGGMWAYESLNFGGYWAWDPVENASLIPWLILLAGLHTMLIYNATGQSLKSTYIFITSSFLLVLYATFLTRSGILGNSSVHSFTDLGLSGQLLVFLVTFIIMTLVALIVSWKNVKSPDAIQNIYNREFWLYIGSLVLLLSALQVLFTTSFPVFNKVLGTNWAPPSDVINHYNTIQLPIAICILVLTAFSQFFKYKTSQKSESFWKNFGVPLLISIILTGIKAALLPLYDARYILMLFAALYGFIGNLTFIITTKSSKFLFKGGAVSHIGFAILMSGVLISSANKEIISRNDTQYAFFSESDDAGKKANREHVLLVKDKPVYMGNYQIIYKGDSVVGLNHYYKVDYWDTISNEKFRLYPNLQMNPKMGNVYNPDTRHYISHDVFTHLSLVSDKKESDEDYGHPDTVNLNVGDTVFAANNAMIILEKLVNNEKVMQLEGKTITLQINAFMKIITLDQTRQIQIPLNIEGNKKTSTPVIIDGLDMRITFSGLFPDKNEKPAEFIFEYKQISDYVVMKAVNFPYINLVWLGTGIMTFGFILSLVRRTKDYRKRKVVG